MNEFGLRVNYDSGEAVYRQIADQLKVGVASGRLRPGQQLPSIRSLSGQLGINARTVIKAYEQLDREGLIVMRHGQGVFVAQNRGSVPVKARRVSLDTQIRKLLADASAMGASLDEVVESLRRVSREFGMEGNQTHE